MPGQERCYLVGEDAVSHAVIRRLLSHAGKTWQLEAHPARSGRIKPMLSNFLQLSRSARVILLAELDAVECAPRMKTDWLGEESLPDMMCFRIAVEEPESWLMADRRGFAAYLGVPETVIPVAGPRKPGESGKDEVCTPYKPSLYMMQEIACHSTDERMRNDLIPKPLARKGPKYNDALVPFISDRWNIERAMKNSYSLRKAVMAIRAM